MGLADLSREGVLAALDEFDKLGRRAFLEKYGFDTARSYFVMYDGRFFDSKPIVGAAHGYSGLSPLGPKDFSGGHATVGRTLDKLGFDVMSATQVPTPIVLVENERTAGGNYDHWKDVTGERYQYPNHYKNKVIEGRPFVYYRGTRREHGRGTPEYFGHGVIGPVYLDPDTEESTEKSKCVNRRETLTPDRRPILTPLTRGV